MSDIIISVDSMGQGPGVSQMRIRGTAYMDSRQDRIEWVADVPINASIATINTAIKDAAVAEAARVGVTVGALDAKTLFGGAVTL